MADNEEPKQTVVVQRGNFSIENSEEQIILNCNDSIVGEGIDDEIIQQAFGDVSHPMEQNGVYKDEQGENVTLIADGSVLTDVSGNVVGTINDDGSTYTLSSSLNLPEATLSNTDKVNDGNTTENADKLPVVSSVDGLTTTSQEILRGELSSGKALQLPTSTNISDKQPLFVIRSPVNSASTPEEGSTNALSSLIKYTPTSLSSQVAPLGSSQNPIRIIQQGNQYTSTQQLNPDQLSQIMQVVQQQQAVRQAKQMGGTSVIYNPETQTKIVYRVINPADLHTQSPDANNVSVKNVHVGASGKTYTGKKRGRKRKIDIKNSTEDTDGPELSRKEKEDKKKNRPKTRSGRVSKPPRHMVKDYKQIHLVDWNEDYDDSDGGYSDYKGSGDEAEHLKRQRAEEEELDDYEKLRPKRFACKGCDRRYIGSGGLERHWANFPDHKTFSKIAEGVAGAERNDKDDFPTDAEASNDSFAHSFKDLDAKNILNGDNSSEATERPTHVDKAQNEAEEKPEDRETKEAITTTTTTSTSSRAPSEGRRTPVNNTTTKRPWGRNSRRFKLMDLLERCADEVVLDVALPRLARICSTWHFLLSKAEAEKEAEEESQREEADEEEEEDDEEVEVKLSFRDVYREYEGVREKMKQLCSECKLPAEENINPGENKEPTSKSLGSDAADTTESTDTLNFEFSDVESATSLGQQGILHKMLSELPQHWRTKPDSMSYVPKFKPTQYMSIGPGSVRKPKAKLYPGAVSVIPALERDSKPRSLGESKPMEESEIRAQMSAKRPPASRLKLWVKDSNSEGEEEEEEEGDFTCFGMRKDKSQAKSNDKSSIGKEGEINNSATKDQATIRHVIRSTDAKMNGSSLSAELKLGHQEVTAIGQLELPDIMTKSKAQREMKCTSETPSVHTVATATAIIHSKPILSVGDTIKATSNTAVAIKLEETQTNGQQQAVLTNIERTQNSIPENLMSLDSNKPTYSSSSSMTGPFCSDRTILNSTSQGSLLLTSSGVLSTHNVFSLQGETSQGMEPKVNVIKSESMMTDSDEQSNSVPTPIVTLIQETTSLQDSVPSSFQNAASNSLSQPILSTVQHVNNSTDTYEMFLQDGGSVNKPEHVQSAADSLDENQHNHQIMELEEGEVVPHSVMVSNSNNTMLAFSAKDHGITTSDMGPFMSQSQATSEGMEQEDSKLQTVQLLADLTQTANNSLPVGQATTFLESTDPTTSVAYQMIDEDKSGLGISDPGVSAESGQVLEGVQLIQTGDGIVLVKNPDGTFQIHSPHDQPIPLETVQALLNLTPQ